MAQKLRTRPPEPIPKPRYRVTNWPDYNRALVERGSVTLWLSDEVARGWRARGGKGCVYSDVAIRCALSLRAVFRLTLRQAQGFLASLANQLLPGLPVPHYSTLCRRAAGLDIPVRACGPGPVHLVVDSTGLKVFGEGEWKVRQHGVSRRRLWRKLHLGVDEATGMILTHKPTPGNVHDGPVPPKLLAQIDGPLDQVSATTASLAIGPFLPRVRALSSRRVRGRRLPHLPASRTRLRPAVRSSSGSTKSAAKPGRSKPTITAEASPRPPCPAPKP